MVPGGGIEPPTRGFSIHCSTPELPGHGNAVRVGWRPSMLGAGGVQRLFEKKFFNGRNLRARIFFRTCDHSASSKAPFQCLPGSVAGHRIGAVQPLGQINVRTALWSRRDGKLWSRFLRHRSDSSFQHLRQGDTAAFALQFESGPRLVQPDQSRFLDAIGLAMRPAELVSKPRRSFLGIGARSSTICPPKPAQRASARGRSLAQAAKLALRPAASDVSVPVFTSTATSARVGST